MALKHFVLLLLIFRCFVMLENDDLSKTSCLILDPTNIVTQNTQMSLAARQVKQ